MRILLTGASGFLGTELLPLLIQRHEVYCLHRSHKPPLGVPLPGDVTQWDLGIENPPTFDAVLHLAALVSFSEKRKADILSVNTDGTLHVCNFCLRHGVPRLYYVSTAYVCGDHTGEWGEQDYSKYQTFRNSYEWSKFLAEGWVRAFSRGFAGFHSPIRTTIFRPGIVVGRSTDGKSTSFEGFYKPVKALAHVASFAERKLKLPERAKVERALHLPLLPLPIAIKGDPEGTLNLVPVDWVAERIVDLLDASPGVYHLTNPTPPKNKDVCELVGSAVGVQGFHFDPDARLLQPHDRLYNLMTKEFQPYLWGEPRFLSSVTPSPPAGLQWLEKVLYYWKETEHAQEVRGKAGAPVTGQHS